MSSNDVVQHVKQCWPATPVILLSGKIKIYDQDTQADVFLPKGMHAPAELLERIRLLLARKRDPRRVTRMAKQTAVVGYATADISRP